MNIKTILASAALAMTAATGALAEKTKVGFNTAYDLPK